MATLNEDFVHKSKRFFMYGFVSQLHASTNSEALTAKSCVSLLGLSQYGTCQNFHRGSQLGCRDCAHFT